MVRTTILVSLVLGLLTPLAVSADSLDGSIEARKVVRRDGGRETFTTASEVLPNDVIEYRLTYANNGESALRGVIVTDPIPNGTEYVSMSATRPQAGAVEFSIDNGATYHTWPVRYRETLEDGTKVWKDATPAMVTHIRWTIAGEFDPESEITFSYRAIVQ